MCAVYSLLRCHRCAGGGARRFELWQAGNRGVARVREADMLTRTTPRFPADSTRLSESSPEPEDSHAARRLRAAVAVTDGSKPMRRNRRRYSCRTRRCIWWALRAPCKFSGSAENLLRCPLLQATDPGPSPERVSAFPSSGEGPGSVACHRRVSAFPSSGRTTGSAAGNQRVIAKSSAVDGMTSAASGAHTRWQTTCTRVPSP